MMNNCLHPIQYLTKSLITLTTVLTLASIFIPSSNAAQVTFRGPFGIAVKPDGSFYVAEINAKRISKFDSQGNSTGYITEIDGYGPLKRPFDVDVSPSGKLYIADNLGNKVLVLDKNEKLLLTLGTGEESAEPGSFHGPHFVHADENTSRIYVSDTQNNRIQVFDFQGKLIKIMGHSGRKGLGQYHFVGGIALDSEKRLYAMNWSGAYINVYNQDLKAVNTLGSRGNKPTQFNDAYSIAFHNNTLWVADTFNNRLQQLTLDGQPLAVVGGQEGQDVHQFSHPTDLDFDAEGNIYVADWKNDRVLKLTPDGHFLRQWGNPAAVMDYTPPAVISQNHCRGPRKTGAYIGIDKKTIDVSAKSGIDWIYPSFNNQDGHWNIKEKVDYARTKGIKIAPSIAVYHMGEHLPQWENKPQYAMRKRGSKESSGQLSYFFPEVRTWKARHIAQQVSMSGVDGLLLDYIRYPDVISGYEPAMVEAFKNEYAKDPEKINPTDSDWLEFRAKFITMFIAELRQELVKLDRPIEIGVYVGPDWNSDLQTVMRDWRTWARMGIIDKLILGIYSRDFESFYEGVLQARTSCPENIKINIMIACWGGNLNTPELLKKGVEVSFAAGADEVSIYRGDSIKKLNLWSTIGEISK